MGHGCCRFSFMLENNWWRNESGTNGLSDYIGNKPQVLSSGGTSTQIDAITALTKQVEALKYHIASMRETYDQNQEAPIQLMQMGQLEEAFQERPLGVLPSDTETYPREERKAVTTMSGLTLDGSFIPHSNFLVYQEEELEPKTITEVMEIASSQSKPLVPPPETPPLSTPKLKENLEPNPHQPPIPCPSRLQNDKFQSLDNPTRRADHFVYRIDIVDSLCDKFPIKNNSLSGNPTPSSDSVIMRHFALISKRRVMEVPLLILIILLQNTNHSVFDIDHIEEKSSGSTTTHSDLSLLEYESFHFDLWIDLFTPSDRSDSHHEEFADELAHIISPLEYEHFYFDLEIVPRDFTIVLKENISETSTKDFTIHELNDFPPLLSDCDSIFSKEFSEIDLLVSLTFRNKDEVFDPRIFIIKSPI
ncbi:hypothetical protein Tco_0245600 [Tanacetum coccineum]